MCFKWNMTRSVLRSRHKSSSPVLNAVVLLTSSTICRATRGRRRPSGPGTGPPALPVVQVGRLGEEVGRHEASHSFQLAHEKAVVVHLAVHVDDVARFERQFHLQDPHQRESITSATARPKLSTRLFFFSFVYY